MHLSYGVTRMKKFRLFATTLVIFFLVGCAHDQEQRKSAQVLFEEASQLASKGKVEKAAETFMEVRTYYPGHDLARKSLLATGDLYFDEELYDTAMESYKEYRLLYPTDLEASYSLYKIGMCYFNQLNTFDRDQSKTVKAIQTFESFIQTYENSPHIPDAKKHLESATLTLARHYIYIGKFYLKNHNKEAACKRFRYVRRQYPDIGLNEEISELITKSCENDNESEPISESLQEEDQE
jgi:outer membrane protein assembly factor BamD